MKRIISSISALALVAITVIGPVNAAGIAVDSAVYDDGTDTITVTDADKDYTVDDVASWSVVTSIGTAVASGDSTEVTEANGSFVITDAVNFDGLVTDTYTLSFSTVSGDFSAVIVAVGAANQVQVTATVEPVLTFGVAGGDVDFGSLNPTGDNTAAGQTTISFVSNATSGIVISGSAVGADSGATAGALGISGSTSVIAAIGSETDPAAYNDAAEYFAVELNTLNATDGSILASNDFSVGDDGTADRANDLDGATALVNSNSTPVDGSFNVEYHIGTIPTTDAGAYAGTITYTAVPTF